MEAPWSASAVVARPSTTGVRTRLHPTPITTASPARSSRMPASLAPSTSRSLGHLSMTCGAPGVAPTASATASPVTSASVCGSGSPGRSTTTVEPMKLPAPSSHCRPARPLPAVWRRATSQSPSRASRPSASRSALVDPVSARTRIKPRGTAPPRRYPPARRALASGDTPAARSPACSTPGSRCGPSRQRPSPCPRGRRST